MIMNQRHSVLESHAISRHVQLSGKFVSESSDGEWAAVADIVVLSPTRILYFFLNTYFWFGVSTPVQAKQYYSL